MPHNVKYLERFEYFCRECEKKGTVLDVLLNPDVLLIRGFCPVCKKRGTYKVIDIEALRQEHEAIAREESASNDGQVWRWELKNPKPKPKN
jgi:ribosomal protein L44E